MKAIYIFEQLSNGSYYFSIDAKGTQLPEGHEMAGYSSNSKGDMKMLAREKGYEILYANQF